MASKHKFSPVVEITGYVEMLEDAYTTENIMMTEYIKMSEAGAMMN